MSHVNGGRGRLVRNLERASKNDSHDILIQWCHIAAREIQDLRKGWAQGIRQKEVNVLPETEAAVHIAELEEKVAALADENERMWHFAAFARSCILSGEPWTETSQREWEAIDAAKGK